MCGYSRLAINQFTTLHQWSLPQAIEGYARHGVHAIGIVRDKLQEIGAPETRRLLRVHEDDRHLLLYRRPPDRLGPGPLSGKPCRNSTRD